MFRLRRVQSVETSNGVFEFLALPLVPAVWLATVTRVFQVKKSLRHRNHLLQQVQLPSGRLAVLGDGVQHLRDHTYVSVYDHTVAARRLVNTSVPAVRASSAITTTPHPETVGTGSSPETLATRNPLKSVS